MATNSIHVDAPPADVFAVLADGWSFSNWVVGASHMRAVNSSWPAPGSRIFHAIGAWPVMRRDDTVVEEVEDQRRLVLTARGRPFGTARIVLELQERDGGCEVRMDEGPVSPGARWLHNRLTDAALSRRNAESLARLAALAERRTQP
jgi:uncharacterized protein YndB with AHSA1/START domain